MAENLRFNLDVDTNTAVSSINTFFQTFDQGAARAESSLRKAFQQPLETEVRLSLKNGEVVATKIKKIGTDTDRITTAAKAMNGEFGKTPAQVQRSLNALKALRDNTQKISDKTGKVSQSWQQVTRRINEATKAKREFSNVPAHSGGGGGMSSMGQAFTAAGIKARLASEAIMAAGRAIQGAISGMVERSRELGRLSTALSAFTSDQEQTNAIMELAQTTGMAYGVSIQSVEGAWKRVGPAATAAGLSLSETNDVITAATARMSQMGLNAEQSGRYMEALAQVMGKGKLQGEELRQQFSELDGALRTQLATFLNAKHGIVDLDDAMKKGEVSSKMFAEGLVAISQSAVQGLVTNLGNLNNQFDELNLEQRFNNLNNIFTVAKQEWGEIFGPFGESIMRVGTMLAGYLATFSTRFPQLAATLQSTFTRIGEVIEMVAYGLLFLFDEMAKAFEWLMSSSDPLAKALRALISPVTSLMQTMGWDQGAGEFWDNSVEGARNLAGEIGAMDQVLSKSLQSQQSYLQGQQAGTAEARAQTQALQEQREVMQDLETKQKDAAEGAKEAKKAYTAQKEVVDGLVASMKARYDDEIAAAQKVADSIKTRIDNEKQSYKDIQAAAKERYDEEKSKIDEIYDAKLAALDLEADALREKTPSEQKLYDLEKKALVDKIASGQLDEEALLRAQARLERMERQEQLEELSVKRKETEKAKAAELQKIEEERDKTLKEAKKNHEAIVKDLEDQLKAEKDKIKELKNQKKELDEVKKGTEAYNGDLNTGLTALQSQVTELGNMKEEWKDLQDKADAYAKTIKQALSDKQSLESDGGGAPAPSVDGALATGGPVVGGGRYQVNELGKEAFLSAAGKLSMINAPSFGTWKAPTAGTVIPAHLTKQLDIPTGGININKTAGMSAGRSMGEAARVIQASGGDTFNQNVTIQSANPTQSANNIMVEMARLRRRRFG